MSLLETLRSIACALLPSLALLDCELPPAPPPAPPAPPLAADCATVLVAGLSLDVCLSSPCGGCDLLASDLNGEYTLVDGLSEQMADPSDAAAGRLPVWARKAADDRWYYIYYDTFSQYSLSSTGEAPGWAIGPTVGTVCTDDWGYCSHGYVPCSCCQHQGGCSADLVKQTALACECNMGCGPDTANRNGCDDDRSLPSLGPETTWKLGQRACQSCSQCGGYTTTYETLYDVTGVTMQCDSASSAAPLTPDDAGIVPAACALGEPIDSTDCRSDRCQGCMTEYSSLGCSAAEPSCGCSS